MDQRKLYRTIETVASKNMTSDEELLAEVVKQIISNEEIKLTGGRIWKLNARKKTYSLSFQTGKVPKISADFSVEIKDYPLFEKIAVERTILADETNKTLISKGILKYSAIFV